MVEWCLIVSTKEEAMLCALARKNQQGLTVIRTKFVIQSDWVSFLSVTSTKEGRIFLGGQDGNLYELDYDLLVQAHYASTDANSTQQQLDKFYDGPSCPCPAVLVEYSNRSNPVNIITKGKRVFDSFLSSSRQPPRKCKKLNHSQSAFSTFLPDLINRVSAAIFGDYTTTGGGPIVQMVVDDERQVLYTLSTRGWICALDIAESPKITLAAVLNAPSTARLYLEAVSRGRMYPPSSSNSREGILSFPGGGEAAQAGVGGMEGARNILKLADTTKSNRGRSAVNSILTPVSIQVVPNQESTRITLVATTAGGLRYYLSSLSPHTLGAGPASPPFGTPRHRHPWKPHSRLTLCHVRAPPSMAENSTTTTSHTPSVPKDYRVDASCYRLGAFFVAFQQTGANGHNTRNVLVTASADSVARITQETKKENTSTTTYIAPGGICEVVSFPMSMDGSTNLATATLPGGRIWDICAASLTQDKVLSLALRSKAPSDTELGFGMAPAYVPPSKRSPSSQKVPRAQSVVPISSSSYNRSVPTLAVTVVTNLLLSRPARYGINIRNPLVPQEERPVLYRISKRCGSQDFSLSAADTKSSGGATSARSARLSPWLLTPDVVPLNPLALQYLENPTTTFMALNAGGLHSFKCPSILQQLSSTILAAGTNMRSDPGVTKFFQSYGFSEGCAMCLFLAMKPSSSQELKESALRAALARAYRPTLMPTQTEDQTSQQQKDDPWIPTGYSFSSSALCEGLTLVLARLLRPIWHKPAVVVTEGRVLKRGLKSKTTPAKVELLLEDDTLETIRSPLYAMQEVMRRVFGKAVENVPLSKNSANVVDQMEIDDDDNHYLTRTLEYQRRGQAQTTTDTLLRPPEAEELAQHIEERNIHSMYRLLSRTVQLLSLLSHLRRAHSMPDLPEVEWGLLHGISIAQLVQTREGQERVESMLNSLITSSSMTSKKATPGPSADANQLSTLFAEQCYHFFSPGSRYAYLGFQSAQEALTLPNGQARRIVRAKEAVDYLNKAARNWYSPSLITGRLLHTRESEGYDEIAQRALQFDSPLAKACSLLISLGDVAAVVDICLLTASNFNGKKTSTVDTTDVVLRGSSSAYPWEKGLYHKRQDIVASASMNGTSSVSSSNALALGTTVTAKDAVATCHALIFYHLTKLLDFPVSTQEYQLGERMVSVCSSASDKDFLLTFFIHLLNRSHKDVLLRIDSPDLEKWLAQQQKEQPDLLLRYYQIQENDVQAGEVAWNRANDSKLDLDLNDRVECLVQALDSYAMAITKAQGNPDELQRRMKQVQERLDIARLQGRVLQTLASTKYELQEDDMLPLSRTLLSVNDLFNKYAMPCDMYENCLLLLHVCRHDDVVHIQQFWKSLFCEEVFPCSTRSEQAYRSLRNFTEGSLLENPVITLLDEGTSAEETLFESGSWMKRLESRVRRLGKEVYGTGADYVFPVDFIASCLEGKMPEE
jgi:nuclear pore complex protein Nup155